jgi:multidrug efflux pump subunit AcrB
MNNIWNFFLNRFRFTYLVLAAILLSGIAAVLILPREANPEIVIPIGVVSTIYPGASPIDVERLITDEIEKEVENLDDIDEFTSTSREGISTVVVNFDAKADVDDSIRSLRDAVSNAEPKLPGGAETPFVGEISFSDQPVVVFGLAADVPEAELKNMAEDFQDEIESISGVSEVTISGARDQEVLVNVDKRKLDQFQIGIADITNAISAANTTFPIGSIQTDSIRYSVRLDAELVDPELIENLPIKQAPGSGIPVYVRDVATVRFDLAEASTRSRVSEDGDPSINAVTLSVKKKSGGDVTKLVTEAQSRIADLIESDYPEAQVITTFDAAEEVQKSLSSLSKNGLATVIIISLLLWLFLGGREALLAGASVPITFLIGFIGLVVFDSSINFLSLFSLILALGIVVDNGIVITEGLHEHIKSGVEPMVAAQRTIKEFQFPLISGTLTTISAFVPMLFMGGMMGQFIRHIPITVNLVLVGSLFTALALMPLLGARFLKNKKEGSKPSVNEKYIRPKMDRFHDWYEEKLRVFLLNKKLKKKFSLVFVGLFIAAMALPITGVLTVIMFPSNDADFFYIDVESPVGTTLDVTDVAVRQVEDVLYEDELITSFFVDIGRGNPLADTITSGTHIASFTINIESDRDEATEDILSSYREKLAFITDAEISVTQVDSGPPTGAPVLIAFKGPDLDELDRLATQASGMLEEIDGAVEVGTSIEETSFEFVINVDRELAVQKGLSPIQIASAIRTAVSGTEATEIRYQGNDVEVVVTQSLNPLSTNVQDRTITTIDEIKQMILTTPSGEQVSVGSIVNTGLAPGRNVIIHNDGDRQTRATAQVSGTTPGAVFEQFEPRINELGLEDGYSIKLGGEAEDVQESFNDLFKALFIGLFLIASILLLQFNSYRQPFFILITLPLALIGVFFGLALIRQPLSFPAFIGIVALSGVVVNDAIILIDKINNNRKEGLSKFESVVLGGRARLQPIILTTLTTVAGILPLTLSDPIWSGLGSAIIFGLMFATVLTLVVIPMLYLRFGEEELG